MPYNHSLKLLAFFVLTLGAVNLPVCNTHQHDDSSADSSLAGADLHEILERKKLIALTDNSSTSYFI